MMRPTMNILWGVGVGCRLTKLGAWNLRCGPADGRKTHEKKLSTPSFSSEAFERQDRTLDTFRFSLGSLSQLDTVRHAQ